MAAPNDKSKVPAAKPKNRHNRRPAPAAQFTPGGLPGTLSGYVSANSGSQREARFRVMDYFDSPSTGLDRYQQWKFDTGAPLIPGTQGVRNVARLHQFRLEALPNFALGAQNGVLVSYTMPAGNPEGVGVATSQKSTYLRPTSNPRWVTVGLWDAKSVFGNSDLEPLADADGVVCGSWVVLNPDDFTVSDQAVQFRVTLDLMQTLPVLASAKYAVLASLNPSFDRIVSGVTTVNSAFVELLGVTSRT